MSSTPWEHHLRRVTIVAPKVAYRIPRRNMRDPRLPSYKPPSPTRYTGKPIIIPLEYTPRMDAKIPVRKFGTERLTRVQSYKLNAFNLVKITPLNLYFIKGAKAPPDMGKIMQEMAAIHAPTLPPRKMTGAFVKATKTQGQCQSSRPLQTADVATLPAAVRI